VPFFLFLKLTRAESHSKRIAAIMGMCVIVGFFIFGLTVEIFNLKMTIAFYSLTVAVLLAAATSRSSN
jgi:O-antigen ligase